MLSDILDVDAALAAAAAAGRPVYSERIESSLRNEVPVVNGRHAAPEGKTRHHPMSTEELRSLPVLSVQYVYISLGEVIVGAHLVTCSEVPVLPSA